MESKLIESRSGILPSAAAWGARREVIPTSIRAVARFYSRTGNFDTTAIKLRSKVETTVNSFLQEAYQAIEEELEKSFDQNNITFSYKTKLTMPVELTLGYLYEQKSNTQSNLSKNSIEVARLVTEALLDGDMRDAINDEEYDDFDVNFDLDPAQREKIAKIAQDRLETRVSKHFDGFPEEVQKAYTTAKQESESHQKEDKYYRRLLEDSRSGSAEAVEKIESEYKHASFTKDPDIFSSGEKNWPYCFTQYKRVGVIYSGMIEMFRAAGVNIEPEFKRAIVLSIIGAQIWLDDIDDYQSDIEEGQLTPVTAEYIIQNSEKEAYFNIKRISQKYFDAALYSAVQSGSDITGIATEYIYLTGDASVLPNKS